MSKDTPADGGHQSVENVAFNSALTNASKAFAGEYHSHASSALKPINFADNSSVHVPQVLSFDTGAAAHLYGPPSNQDLAERIVKNNWI